MKKKNYELSTFEFLIKIFGIVIAIIYLMVMPNNLGNGYEYSLLVSKAVSITILIYFTTSLEKNAMLLRGEL